MSFHLQKNQTETTVPGEPPSQSVRSVVEVEDNANCELSSGCEILNSTDANTDLSENTENNVSINEQLLGLEEGKIPLNVNSTDLSNCDISAVCQTSENSSVIDGSATKSSTQPTSAM